MAIKPTKEQEEIIDGTIEHGSVRVNAVAGSGKSSTLEMLANAIIEPSIYLAFNKALQLEAQEKFPSHVKCQTINSLAFRAFGFDIQHKLSPKRTGKYVNMFATSTEIARGLYISPMYGVNEGDELSAKAIAACVKNAVVRFEQSADQKVEARHLPNSMIVKYRDDLGIDANELKEAMLRYTKTLWKYRTDPSHPAKADHSTYVKLYQLSNPTIPYKWIYSDESQDVPDVFIDILKKQTDSNLIVVGDSYQSIYGFAGAVDAMNKFSFPSYKLSMSFRFGDEIAAIARTITEGALDIKGNPNITSEVGEINRQEPYTKLFRTNAQLLTEASQLITEGVEVDIEIDMTNFKKLVSSAVALKNNDHKMVKHDVIAAFSEWRHLMDESKVDPELKRIATMVETGMAESLLDVLEHYKKPRDPQVVMTTSHKSKGRQWDNCILADDFPSNYDKDGVWVGLQQQERNLLYVASTRAQKKLQINNTVYELIHRERSYE